VRLGGNGPSRRNLEKNIRKIRKNRKNLRHLEAGSWRLEAGPPPLCGSSRCVGLGANELRRIQGGPADGGAIWKRYSLRPMASEVINPGKLRLKGRRCVRCGRKLEGYRRFFCGAECKRADYREKKQLKRAQGRTADKCPLCGRWVASRKPGVTRDTRPSSHDRGEGKGGGRAGGLQRL
jgi:hypothetical protein